MNQSMAAWYDLLMHEIFQSVFIGVVQGVSEFFPISSSGHLVLIPYFFKWNYQGINFDIALHFGTTIALLIYFWKDWILIVRRAIDPKFNNGVNEKYPANLLWQIIVATIPAIIAGILLRPYEDSLGGTKVLIAINLAVFGIILYLVDKRSQIKLEISKINYLQSFLIGCAQAVALVPGVSRSGITITASRGLGLNRESAARYSFLLSTPAILGAFVLSLSDLSIKDINTAFISGVIAATIFGLIAIKYLLKYLQKSDFAIFMYYRILVALAIILLLFFR